MDMTIPIDLCRAIGASCLAVGSVLFIMWLFHKITS